jgi:hypothetical protein
MIETSGAQAAKAVARAFKAVALLAAISGAPSVGAQSAGLVIPAGFEIRRVEPGNATTLVLDVTNTRSSPQTISVEGILLSSTPSSEYSFSALPGDCTIGQGQFDARAFMAGLLQPGATRRCSFRVDRATSSSRDLAALLLQMQSGGSARVYFGRVADRTVGLQLAEPVDFEDTSVILRLSVTNLDAVGVSTTEAFVHTAGLLEIDGNLAGGCVTRPAWQCGNIPPPLEPDALVSIAFTDLAPHETRSCLLRAGGSAPIATLSRAPIFSAVINRDCSDTSQSELVPAADPVAANDFAVLGPVQPVLPVPIGGAAIVVASALVGLAGARKLRAETDRARRGRTP